MISVVIPAFNEEKLLGQCLESLVKQKTNKPFEVIVVNNASSDGTRAVAEQFAGRLVIKIIEEPRQGRGQARHSGFRAATGEIIFSTDADAIVPSNWIEKLTEVLQIKIGVAVAGPARLSDGPRFQQWAFNFIQPLSARGYKFIFGHYWLPGFNFAIRREAYFAAGEFDPTMDALEDTDLAWRVKNKGEIYFATDVPVWFSGRRFKRGLARGLLEYALAFIKYFFFKKKNIHWSNIR